ncbi:MAG: Flp pilus assembly protein CpaB [Acidobacteriota bacterium]
MKKKNLLTLLGIALVVALLSTGVFYGLFVTKLKSNADSGKTLVVAAKPLVPGTVLAADDVKVIAWPADTLPEGAFQRADQVTGKTVFGTISTSEPILEARLASEQGGGQGAGVPTGMRAVSVHISDSSGVLDLLHVGHKVDVQVMVTKPNNSASAKLRTALEDLEVLAVNLKPEASSQGFNLPVVVLLAKPADADVLGLADSGARLRLTLRNPLDTATRTRTPLTLPTVLQTALQ